MQQPLVREKKMGQARRTVKHRPTTPAPALDKDASIAALIAGLNYLTMQAQMANLGTAARILCTAKEDMVHWAVDMNFHESARDQFINSQLCGPFGNGVNDLIAHMSGVRHGGSPRRRNR